jgi:hypothetical protein
LFCLEILFYFIIDFVKMKKNIIFYGSLIIVIALAMILSQLSYRLTFWWLLTGQALVKPGCHPKNPFPKLNLHQVKECSELTEFGWNGEPLEPCVIRNAVSQAKIDRFIQENSHHKFLVRGTKIKAEALLGNPLLGQLSLGDQRMFCSIDEVIHDETCKNMYLGFRSLNYSHYEVLESLPQLRLTDFTRTDIFLGFLNQTMTTASFHSNNFEKSTTLQLMGEKIWLLMKPQDFYTHLGGYSVGGFNAAYSVCLDDLADIPFQVVHTYPGDLMRFPKAWPHDIYSFPGPNIMINFRAFALEPWKFRDFLALIGQVTRGVPQPRSQNCDPDVTAPTNFVNGYPGKMLTMMKAIQQYDLRCAEFYNPGIYGYKYASLDAMIHDYDVDKQIFEQLINFLHK